MKRKLISIFCIIALCFTTVIPSFGAETSFSAPRKGECKVYVNPHYADQIEPDVNAHSNFRVSSPKLKSIILDTSSYDTTIDAAAAKLRSDMVNRDNYVLINYKLSLSSSSDPGSVAEKIFEQAVAHTGNPKEGDSLDWVWSMFSCYYDYYQSGNDYYIDYYYEIEYYTTLEQEQELDQYVTDLKKQLHIEDLSDAEKVKHLYDYICDHIVYDYANVNDESYELQYTAYAALVHKTAVCQGYAVLLYRLCLEYGIDARVITGYAGEGHAWNIIKMGDLYYYADSTWDAEAKQMGFTAYDYYLKGSNNFLKDHILDEEYTTTSFKQQYSISATDYVPSKKVTLKNPVISITTVASSGKPKVSWQPVENATNYEVWRKVGTSGTYAKYYTTKSTSMVNNNNVTAGKTYYYKVKAVHKGTGNTYYSGFSNEKYVTCDLARPTVNVAIVASTGKPKVAWNKVNGASKYEVWRKTGASGTYAKYYTTTGTSMINSNNVIPGKIYYYKVKAVCSSNSAGNSAFSIEKYKACDLAQPVTKLTMVASSGKPKLTWSKVTGASKYEVWRKIGKNGTYSKLYTTTGTGMTNTSAVAGNVYYYKVKAICSTSSSGNSAFSSVKYGTCDCAKPVVTITLNSKGKPKLSWKKVTGASKYEVWRKVGKSGTYKKFYTTTATGLTNSSAKKGTTYYYKVKAICKKSSAGNSAYSNAVSKKSQ